MSGIAVPRLCAFEAPSPSFLLISFLNIQSVPLKSLLLPPRDKVRIFEGARSNIGLDEGTGKLFPEK
jgi:hypothetical protein